MKIRSNKPPEAQGPDKTPQGPQKTSGPSPQETFPPAPKTGPAEKADLSGKRREVADIVAAAGRLPDVREDRIQEVKQAVESGAYKVDPMKVAESILKDL